MSSVQRPENQAVLQAFLEQRDRLFAYIFALVRHMADAEDLFQEVSLVIMKKGQEGVDVENFGAWSREIARRTILNHWKTKKRKATVFRPKVR